MVFHKFDIWHRNLKIDTEIAENSYKGYFLKLVCDIIGPPSRVPPHPLYPSYTYYVVEEVVVVASFIDI